MTMVSVVGVVYIPTGLLKSNLARKSAVEGSGDLLEAWMVLPAVKILLGLSEQRCPRLCQSCSAYRLPRRVATRQAA
jgi:hypothetical protein